MEYDPDPHQKQRADIDIKDVKTTSAPSVSLRTNKHSKIAIAHSKSNNAVDNKGLSVVR
jgi:hypothetical protein